jgi:2,4-diketo-3-deoxy-L-fuconate hydrolase
MKLLRCGEVGRERPCVQLPDGRRIDASGFGEDFDEPFFGGDGIARLSHWVAKNGERAAEIGAEIRLASPLRRPSKIVCVGLNYRVHAKESGLAVPSEPVIFMKATSAIVGPNDDLIIPKGSSKTDWEVELGIVIGRRASYVTEGDALDHVAGYVLHNDYSERAFQLERGGQWVKGKSCDTFAPLGPFVVTRDEIRDVQALDMWLTVNGEMKQKGSTRDMVFGVPFLVSYISQFMTLCPGDIISTGTPAGVAAGHKPTRYIQEGDLIALGIEGLGESRQRARAWTR